MLRRLMILTALAICGTGGLSADELLIVNESGYVRINVAPVYIFPGTSKITFESDAFSIEGWAWKTFPALAATKGTRHLLVASGNVPLTAGKFQKKADVNGLNEILVPIGRTAGLGSKKTGIKIIQNDEGVLDYREIIPDLARYPKMKID